MCAIVKFKDIQAVTNFEQVVAPTAGWELKRPLNTNAKNCVRVIDLINTKNDKVLYDYLRDLGAFEEVAVE